MNSGIYFWAILGILFLSLPIFARLEKKNGKMVSTASWIFSIFLAILCLLVCYAIWKVNH
jgi:hypothetical protein